VEDSTTDLGKVCQTDLTCVGITAMQSEISYLQTKIQELSDQLSDENPYSMESRKKSDEKVKHFTGLTCFYVLFALFKFLEAS
jgi:TolA-binding protein